MNLFRTMLLCLLLCSAISCEHDDNTTGPGKTAEPVASEYGTVRVIAVDEKGGPVIGVAIEVDYTASNYPDTTFKALTDNKGIAVFDSLIPGIVEIQNDSFRQSGPRYYFQEAVAAGQTSDIRLLVPKGPFSVTFIIKGFQNNQYSPMTDISISFEYLSSTGSNQAVTGANGVALMENIDPRVLTSPYDNVNLERNGLSSSAQRVFTAYTQGKLIYENEMLYVTINSDEDPFEPTILAPEPDSRVMGPAVHLSCSAYDFEDGELPDEAIVWSSDQDGVLGTGRELIVALSTGLHKIKAEATDSCDQNAWGSIHIYVSHFASDSYFPLPFDGYWNYRFDPLSFSVTNEWGEVEHWVLDDMTVTSDGIEGRTCTMDWTITRGGTIMSAQYTLTDHITIDGEQFSVSSTDELLTVFDGPDILDPPVEALKAITTYSPAYPLLSDYLDPGSGGQLQVTVLAETSITHTLVGMGLHTYNQNRNISVSCTPGSPTTVTTPLGTFETVSLASSIGDIERTWYLAPNIGIVRFDTLFFGMPITAHLCETSMDTFIPAARIAGHTQEGVKVQDRIKVTNAKERITALREIMRGLSPF